MTFSPITQITLIWISHTAFILYFIICQPLKVRWMRLTTLIIELLSYGCVALSFIIGVIDRFAELDATTANEIGLVFLILTIGSTMAGRFLSLIQVLQLIKAIYQYLKNRRAGSKRVHPIALAEPHATFLCPTPSTDARFEAKAIGTDESSLKSNPPSISKIKELSEGSKTLLSVGRLSPELFEKGPEEKQLLEDLKEWLKSAQKVLRKNHTLNDEDNKPKKFQHII